MLELAAFTGRLLGTMIDPLLWGGAIAVHFYFKGKGFGVKFPALICLVFFVAFATGAFSFPGDQIEDHITRSFYSVLAAAIWLSIVMGIARLFRKSPSAMTPDSKPFPALIAIILPSGTTARLSLGHFQPDAVR